MIPAGFEPATVRLEGECSIQLSYETDTFSFYQKNLLSSRFTYGRYVVEFFRKPISCNMKGEL